jgi:hypothetical protein
VSRGFSTQSQYRCCVRETCKRTEPFLIIDARHRRLCLSEDGLAGRALSVRHAQTTRAMVNERSKRQAGVHPLSAHPETSPNATLGLWSRHGEITSRCGTLLNDCQGPARKRSHTGLSKGNASADAESDSCRSRYPLV